MARLDPFRGIRMNPGIVSMPQALCPPYDAVSTFEQYRYYLRSPYNAVRLEQPQRQPTDTEDDNAYTRAGTQLRDWLAEGVLVQDPEPSLYLYEQSFRGRTRRGILASVRLDRHAGGIYPLERTLDAPKEDRLQLMRATRTNTSPLLALYEDPDSVVREARDAATSEQLYGFTDEEGVEHRLWKIDDQKSVAAIAEQFGDRPLILADGQHRYETALAYQLEQRMGHGIVDPQASFNYALTLLIDASDPGLLVEPMHRMLRRARPGDFLVKLADRFDIQAIPMDGPLPEAGLLESLLADLVEAPIPPFHPSQASIPSGNSAHPPQVPPREKEPKERVPHLGMIIPGEPTFYVLKPRNEAIERIPDRLADWKQLDTALIHHLIIEELFGIPEEEWSPGGAIAAFAEHHEALAAIASEEFTLIVFLPPTRLAPLKAAAIAGATLPPQSLRVYPLAPAGLLIHSLEGRHAEIQETART